MNQRLASARERQLRSLREREVDVGPRRRAQQRRGGHDDRGVTRSAGRTEHDGYMSVRSAPLLKKICVLSPLVRFVRKC